MNTTSQNNLSRLIPVMLCFFAMGFVDLVGGGNSIQLCEGRPWLE